MEILPLARTRSASLVRWTTLTGFTAGFVWLVPATAALVHLGLPGLLVLGGLLAGACAWSVVQARLLVAGDQPEAWPAEWTLALGGIGPNTLLGALASAATWGSLGPLALLVGLAAMGAGTGLAQLPALVPALAVGRPTDASGWRLLAVAAGAWVGLELGVALAAAVWLLL